MPKNFRVVLAKVLVNCNTGSTKVQCTMVSMCPPNGSIFVGTDDPCSPHTGCVMPTLLDPIDPGPLELAHASADELKALHEELSTLLGSVHGHLKAKDPSFKP